MKTGEYSMTGNRPMGTARILQRADEARAESSLGSRSQESVVHLDSRLASYFRWKGVLDRVVALILLVPALPMIAILALLVRLTSPGRGVFRQVRLGRNGRLFTMYKIRTMRHDAEVKSGAVWCRPGDPRITGIGKVLRKFHLDELPQLFNVFRGEMSLVGPRPERPEIAPALAEHIPGYLQRLAVCPGITGLAQLNLPADTDLDSVRRKLILDLEYIRTAGFFLDVRLLLCTFGRILKLPVRRLLRVERAVALRDKTLDLSDGSTEMQLRIPGDENGHERSDYPPAAAKADVPAGNQVKTKAHAKVQVASKPRVPPALPSKPR